MSELQEVESAVQEGRPTELYRYHGTAAADDDADP